MKKQGTSSPRAVRKQPAHGKLPVELIGEEVEVVKSGCRDLQGIEGVVLDETRNTFVLSTSKGRKTIPKKSCVFRVGENLVEGKRLCHRPEDRFKKTKRNG